MCLISNSNEISIHALLAESDNPFPSLLSDPADFNPRSPCGERPSKLNRETMFARFQSTLSLRRATLLLTFWRIPGLNFNPRSPCGERLSHPSNIYVPINISIHALLAESDVPASTACRFAGRFQSTLSLRRATIIIRIAPRVLVFQSTLSLRRATRCSESSRQRRPNFNPRSPCGERLANSVADAATIRFQSTLSLRRATIFPSRGWPSSPISIHALLAESDFCTSTVSPTR